MQSFLDQSFSDSGVDIVEVDTFGVLITGLRVVAEANVSIETFRHHFKSGVVFSETFKVIGHIHESINHNFPAFISLLSPGEPELEGIITTSTSKRAMSKVNVFSVLVQ